MARSHDKGEVEVADDTAAGNNIGVPTRKRQRSDNIGKPAAIETIPDATATTTTIATTKPDLIATSYKESNLNKPSTAANASDNASNTANGTANTTTASTIHTTPFRTNTGFSTRLRRPNGGSEAFIRKVAASKNPRLCPCPVPGCRHAAMTHNLHLINKRDNSRDVPRLSDGKTVDWRFVAWKPVNCEGYSWNNFLKAVINHFEYEIENGCKQHRLLCPEVIKVGAQLDLRSKRKKKDPTKSKYYKLRMLLDITDDATT